MPRSVDRKRVAKNNVEFYSATFGTLLGARALGHGIPAIGSSFATRITATTLLGLTLWLASGKRSAIGRGVTTAIVGEVILSVTPHLGGQIAAPLQVEKQ